MSLGNEQFKQALKEAVAEELSEGRIPDVQAIEQQILLRYDRARAGTSQYLASPIAERSLSNPATLNDNFARMGRDLSFAFSFVKRERQRVSKVLSASQERTMALVARLQKLSRELEMLSLMLPVQKMTTAVGGALDMQNPFGTTHLETFASTAQLDPKQTTAQIDVSSNLAMLGFARNTQIKVKPQLLAVIFDKPRKHSDLAAPHWNLLDDALDTEWRHMVEGEGRVTISLKVTLKEAHSLTRLKLQSNSPQATRLRLFASYDDTNEFLVGEERWTTSEETWTLPASPLRFLRLEMTKDFPDEGPNTYHFGLKSLDLMEDTFDNQSEIVTLPFSVPRFGYLAFAFDADTPANTRVKAYVKVNGDWQPVNRFTPQNPSQDQLWVPPAGLPDLVDLTVKLVLERDNLQATPAVRWFSVMTSQATLMGED